MSIFVDSNTKVIYQGLTGSQGRYYGLLNRDYGTQVVGAPTPKKPEKTLKVSLSSRTAQKQLKQQERQLHASSYQHLGCIPL